MVFLNGSPGTNRCIFHILQILVKKHRVRKIPITYGKIFFINIKKFEGVPNDVRHPSVKKYSKWSPGTHGCIFHILQILVKKHRVSKILITYGIIFFIKKNKIEGVSNDVRHPSVQKNFKWSPGTHGYIFHILQILVKKHRVSKILITYGKIFFINKKKFEDVPNDVRHPSVQKNSKMESRDSSLHFPHIANPSQKT